MVKAALTVASEVATEVEDEVVDLAGVIEDKVVEVVVALGDEVEAAQRNQHRLREICLILDMDRESNRIRRVHDGDTRSLGLGDDRRYAICWRSRRILWHGQVKSELYICVHSRITINDSGHWEVGWA